MFEIHIDFQSDEALYLQLYHQLILGIATSQLREGDVLPSVRLMADSIGINMHTVNKAYSLLRQDGLLSMDNRRGAVIRIDADHLRALQELSLQLQKVLARCVCRHVSREEVHEMVDGIFDSWGI